MLQSSRRKVAADRGRALGTRRCNGITVRHPKQHFHRQAGLNGSIAVGLLAATRACRRGIPAHRGIEPDGQRSPALERVIVGWPVPGPVGRGCGSAHAPELRCWIHEMNPSRNLRNRPIEATNWKEDIGANSATAPTADFGLPSHAA